MRGMMVTTMGEDYVTFAEAKGLKSPTIFLRYCLRNAILPQTTALALALGQILSGAVLVEVIFGYPGIGALLFQAIRENDHFLIQGIVFTVIVALGLATLILDVVYPWLDPRISYRRRGVTTRFVPPGATCAATASLARRHRACSSLLALFIVIGSLTVDTELARPLSVRAAAAAVVGASVRHRPAGPRPARGDGRRHAADPARSASSPASSASASAPCWPSSPAITAA